MLDLLESPVWSEAGLKAFVAKALAAGLDGRTRRELLLLHLPRSTRDRFPEFDSPAAQLLSDLRQLGALELKSFGPGPFVTWCENAAELVHWQFAEELRQLEGCPSPVAPKKRKPPPRQRPKGKLIAVTIVMLLLAVVAVMGRAAYNKYQAENKHQAEADPQRLRGAPGSTPDSTPE